jgi:hypothetical protein
MITWMSLTFFDFSCLPFLSPLIPFLAHAATYSACRAADDDVEIGPTGEFCHRQPDSVVGCTADLSKSVYGTGYRFSKLCRHSSSGTVLGW